ncbi:glycosyltransferase family 4 protein [Yangia mangrovi]|uniref:Glycosyltransferase family 4 protein n=1 Tax=Alloyangia mangrovi TaxID=1779329 RepID=A0A2A3JZ45_9RHOB|nr:glycosyltransferase family 4 protein [Alloyangia mangrovi]MCT4372279.1 glycosyltransferase family 4 protein [Alloyangia mangrovi]
MKVLIIAKAYPPDVGGVQSYSEFVARAYLKAGVIPVVVTSWEGRRGWHERNYPEGTISVLNLGMASQPIVFARMLISCGKLCRKENFDFFHSTTWRPALAILPWKGKTPVVLTVHGREVLNYPAIMKTAMSHVLRTTDLLVTVSNASMEMAESALSGAQPRGEWEVDFNGLSYIKEATDFMRPSRNPEDLVRILSFARLVERKNVQGCLRALAILRDRGITNFHYTVAGTGPMREMLTALIDELNLHSFVTMSGYVKDEDIPKLYRGADIFLHPQTAPSGGLDLEGFGLVIADAMSFGAAAIAGVAGGPKDFVKHGVRGLIVNGENTEEIAAALESLLTNSEKLDRLAGDGRTWALKTLSWDRHVTQILNNLRRRVLISAT